MRVPSLRNTTLAGASVLALALAAPVHADEYSGAESAAEYAGAEIIVTGARTTYNNSQVNDGMAAQQTPLTSPLSLIDNLPGVSVQEGDTFGFDDWSTTVALRGFQTNLDEQQVGITIDGLPNGGSNYGGGAKANRYIDSMNIGTVNVSQGTSDIGSLSNEALGGTLDFVTSDPLEESRVRFSVSLGENDAQRFYVRYDTGQILGGMVQAWISASHQEATDWVNSSAENERDHIAAKFTTNGPVKLTGYISYDDTHEDNYQRLFSPAEFASDPDWDRLTAEWTSIPYVDQLYRKGWSTLRENFFTYLKAETSFAESIDVRAAAYFHKNAGRGDWVPPYIVDVIADGAGNPESELTGARTEGGSPLGRIYFFDANGVALSPDPACVSSITFPYGGAGPEYDPACYPAGAVGAQSYRHTHYGKERLGFTTDFSWETDFGGFENMLRGGIWYEDTTRREWRDWHKITDTRVGYDYDNPSYWTQYRRKYPQDTFKWFLQDEVQAGPVTASFGIKQFINHLERIDLLGDTADAKIKSKSDVLISGGIRFEPMDGLDFFAGYAENFKALGDEILERPLADIDSLQPETAENIEVGLRYNSGPIQASATYFNSKFDNRIIFLANNTDAGPDYLIGTNGTYFNAGGIDSEGFELVVNAAVAEGVNLFGSFTHIDAKYKGTGDPLVDAAVGITPGNRVTGIPKSMFALSADFERGPFRFGISGKYTGKRYVDIANSWQTDSYFLTDAYVGVRGDDISEMLEGLDFSLVVNNLTDESYLGGISGGGAWIGAPRTLVFTVTADF
ncbi:MAG: TonB-dependent receptor [Novosphingobium sp.]|nr:TonB-dependent receptor [Novosphingobium sp.]MCP5403386.1 TonB-dependent receptor [Novosphingobium sp.]